MRKRKDIQGYEGLYIASIYGEIKSLLTNKILKQTKPLKGYSYVTLYKQGKRKNIRVHRIIAYTFLGKSKECVNHKNLNKLDNRLDNLEWCTYSENSKHAYDIIGFNPMKGKLGKLNHRSLEINQYTLDGLYIKTRECAEEIKRQLNIDQSCVIKCCKGKRNKAGGFKRQYK